MIKRKYIKPELLFEEIEELENDFILVSRGWSIDGEEPIEVKKEGDSWIDEEDGDEEDDGWGDFIDVD